MPVQSQRFFRCRVAEEQSLGCLRIGRIRLRVHVDEKSIDGFTIRMTDDDLARLRFRKKEWVLEQLSEQSSVRPEWFLNHADGVVQLGLRRIADLTPPPPVPSGLAALFSLKGIGACLSSCCEIWLGCAALLLLAILTLPGMGDYLGTAPRIRQGSSLIVRSFDEFFRGFFPH